MRLALPVVYCPECAHQLLPNTWHVVTATGADVCIHCARSNHAPGACRPRTTGELARRAINAGGLQGR